MGSIFLCGAGKGGGGCDLSDCCLFQAEREEKGGGEGRGEEVQTRYPRWISAEAVLRPARWFSPWRSSLDWSHHLDSTTDGELEDDIIIYGEDVLPQGSTYYKHLVSLRSHFRDYNDYKWEEIAF